MELCKCVDIFGTRSFFSTLAIRYFDVFEVPGIGGCKMRAALRVTMTRQTTTMATPPPGLERFASVQVSTSGGSGKWFDLPPVKLYTVSLIIKSGKVMCVDFSPAVRLLTCGWPSVRFYLALRSGDSGRTCKSSVAARLLKFKGHA